MKDRIAAAALKSASVYIVYITILVIVTDLSPSFKSFLTGITGHHWSAKSLTGLILFLILTALFSRMQDDNVEKGIKITMLSTVCGFAVILGFYLIHG